MISALWSRVVATLVALVLAAACASTPKTGAPSMPLPPQAAAPSAATPNPAPAAPPQAAAPALRVNTAIVPVPQRLEDNLPQNAVTNFTTRHDRYVARARQGDVDLLFLGDSIMQGWEGPGKPVWDEYYASMKAAAFGIGYDRTQHLLWRLENGEAQGLSPRVVVLLIGTNNLGPNTVEETALGITAVVGSLRAKFPQAKILLLGVLPRGMPGSTPRQNVAAVNAIVSKLDDRQRVFYRDLSSAFVDAEGVIARDVMADLLHPTEKGYRLWAEAMKDGLAALR